MHLHVDNAETTAAAARSLGEPTLTVADGSAFGSPTPETPLRVSVYDSATLAPKTILKCVGRSGDDLDIDGPDDGKADAAVDVGDLVVGSPWTAGAVQEVYDAIAAGGAPDLGRVEIAADGDGDKITTTGDELVLEQAGDEFGATRLRLRNRQGFNGAVFEVPDLGLVDFGFDAAGATRSIRFESRDGQMMTGGPEFRFGNPDLPTLVAGNDILARRRLLASSALALNHTTVSTTPYNLTADDCVLAVTGPASARSIVLPHDGPAGWLVVIKDEAGDAATHNITVAVASSGTIDGDASKVINTNYGSLRLFLGESGKWFAEEGGSGGGGGGLASIGLTMPGGFVVSGSPLTADGTIAVSTGLSGIVKASAGGFASAIAGTDYATPADVASAVAGAALTPSVDYATPTDVATAIAGAALTPSVDYATPADVAAVALPPGGETGQILAKASAGFVWIDPPTGGGTIDESDLVHKSGDETITGKKTFEGSVAVQGGLSVRNSAGAEASAFDADGVGFIERLSFAFPTVLRDGADQSVNAAVALYSGKLDKLAIKAEVNPSSGGFAVQITRNGTPILSTPFAVAAGDTATKFTSAFASTTVNPGDVFKPVISGSGAGVNGVSVVLGTLCRNR